MTRTTSEVFWSLICDFKGVVISIWSISLVFFAISFLLLVSGVSDQEAILTVNIVILSVPLVISFIILAKCKQRP